MKKPVINQRDYRILSWYYHRKKDVKWLSEKFNVSRSYVRELIETTREGFTVKGDLFYDDKDVK